MRARVVAAAAGSALMAVAALAGCSSDSTEESVDAYCATLDETRTEISALGDLIAANATADEVRSQADEVRSSLDQLADDADAVDASLADDIDEALQAYDDAVSDIPGDLPLSEAATEYDAAGAQLRADLDAVADQVTCT